jgi:NAD(P)-dependent dehydrogenase (short-subunit alcohol dehydrogenase family)
MRSVVVTGASTGIGRASALHLDAAGWRVFAGVRREQDAESLRKAASERLIPLRLDITDRDQVDAAAEAVAATVGDTGLDGLVNNAGITIPCPIEAMPLDDFDRLIAVNVTGQLAATQALLPQVRRAKGRIVFLSSISARRAMPMLGGYTASKAALNALADGLRQELRPFQVGVSIVEPGLIETPMWDRGEDALEGALKRSPVADVEHLYGKLIAAVRDMADRSLKRRISPEKVVAAIEHALTAGRPRARYVVGVEAKGQALTVRFVPDRLLDFGVARYLKL